MFLIIVLILIVARRCCEYFLLVFFHLFPRVCSPSYRGGDTQPLPRQVLIATIRRAQPEVVFPDLPEGEDVKVRRTRILLFTTLKRRIFLWGPGVFEYLNLHVLWISEWLNILNIFNGHDRLLLRNLQNESFKRSICLFSEVRGLRAPTLRENNTSNL